MTSSGNKGDQISANISGEVSGQMAVGKNISQVHQFGPLQPLEVTPAELEELKGVFKALKAQISTSTAPERRDSALERVDELEEAVTADKPDLTTVEYVKQWFVKHLPALSGAVTGVIIHPIVGKLVEASGDMAAEEFRRRFQP
ncbi:hypothetical protein [Adonisia turfae]|uniref:Uncharacterized protein n=1 Tax=Adonisia turfae CCMR0081 TaxID=2292702 RepID=A0A6M0RG46_9CYAN|nr:hypothetical protein [Adonisia turfae]NEZ55247.1 hypothetical protein [Adonisia turfae CCMR0081]